MFELRGVVRDYPLSSGLFARRKRLQALRDVDLEVREGELLGLVGESGCGKSTLARILLHLEPPTRGFVRYRGRDLWQADRGARKAFRREVQMVFQDPYASLNPRMRVGDSIGEGMAIHGLERGAARRRRVGELLEQVGLPPEAGGRYPHEFSGGQRQRIGIARALAVGPRVIVADEPLSALDVSIQAQVLNLLMDLKRAQGLTYVLISHDLRVVRHVADRVGVMYLGRLVEVGPAAELFADPRHPYTRLLLASAPVPEPRGADERDAPPAGEAPNPVAPPAGCGFHPRCPDAVPLCRVEGPLPQRYSEGRLVACHRVREPS